MRAATTQLLKNATMHEPCVTKIYPNSATRTYMYELVMKLGLSRTDNRFHFTLYSLSVFSLAKSLQLILETRATYKLISYLLANL